MRLNCVLAAAALAVIGTAAPDPTRAEGMESARPAKSRVVRRHAQAPRFAHVFNIYGYPAASEDPWAYSYQPRRYYPYYDSAYWRPHSEMRYRYRYDLALGDYYSSWGYPVVCHTPDRLACARALTLRRR